MIKEEELREGLKKLVGGRRAEDILKDLREGREVSYIEKRRLVNERPVQPLTPQEIAAIQANLGITPSASSSSDEK